MWLWILSALFLALVWGVWLVLHPPGAAVPAHDVLPFWIPVAITVAVVVFLVGLAVFRRLRAARAARALERAIAQQAQQQALTAKPERVAEIQELHRQIQQGIASLKASQLGFGKRGADALYVLPWYVMVGPPGAGKTTALKHSGLVFPYLDPSGGGVRGVGGTRNCDWWFTNEAILLDTAGRYTTESDDHDEWMAFLGELLRFRGHKPLNGVVIAISLSELLDATEDQIRDSAGKIRARIDEMQSTLKMVLPVYVLFTKVDLVAGFAEFFGDFKKSERSQAWGATFRLDADKRSAGKLFDAEFDTLVERLHARSISRLITPGNRDTKEKVYQFPLEFAAVKRNLSDFLAAAFAPTPAVAPVADKSDKAKGKATEPAPQPILRGFYFTSGVQEGKPMDRVVGAMARAFGLRAEAAAEPAESVESKSFFLKDVFTTVIFPDQDLAGRTEGEVRRVRIQRTLVAAAAVALALLLLIPAILSFGKNRALIADTARISDEARKVVWTDGGSASDKVAKLDPLLDQTNLLETYKDNPPVGYTFFMFQGDKLFEPTKNLYLQLLHDGFVVPTKETLEGRLATVKGDPYIDDFEAVKTYLLLGKDYRDRLSDPKLADWEKARLTQAWLDTLRRTSGEAPPPELRDKLKRHVEYYVDLLSRKLAPGEELNPTVLEQARDTLRKVGPIKEYYDRFIKVLIRQKYEETGSDARENLKYPPVTLYDMFSDRPDVLSKLRSTQKDRTGKWAEVEGPYTYKGHKQVLASLADGTGVLEREKWVVPLTEDEKEHGAKIKQALERVREDYDREYIRQWVNFFRDLDVDLPPSNRDAIAEYTVLSTPEWPYQRLLRALADNTQFDDMDDESLAGAATVDGGIADQLRQKIQRKFNQKTGIKYAPPGQEAERYDPVPDKFKSMVRFAVPPPQPPLKEGEVAPPPAAVELGNYVGKLHELAAEMGNIEDGPANADTKGATAKFEEAVKTTNALILKLDDTGQDLLSPLLLHPLKAGYKAVMRHAGGAASGLWEVMVYPTYRDKIKDRYPFNLAATRDASFQDAVAFFKPKDGVLWGFYDQALKSFHTKQNHDFIPESHLEARPRPSKPFTPFNPNLYNCLKRADEITEALWPDGAEKPKVELAINMKTVSPIVSEVVFELDGQKRVYRNEKEVWLPVVWPGPKPLGARIQVRGAGGLDEEIVREGPWGLFRLLEVATTTADRDSDQVFTATWEMSAPPVSVTIEIRPTRSGHPFSSSFFRALNCPPSIGDRQGKGKG